MGKGIGHTGDRCPFRFTVLFLTLQSSALYLGRSYAHAITVLQDMTARHWLAVNSDEVIICMPSGELLAEELFQPSCLLRHRCSLRSRRRRY